MSVGICHLSFLRIATALACVCALACRADTVITINEALTGSLAHIRSGAVRLVAVCAKTRSEFVPDAPTIAESVPGYEANSWCGVGVPRGTPAEIIARLNAEINAGLVDPATRARLATVATTPIFYTADGFGAYVAQEIEKWGKVIHASGVKLE